MTAPDPGAFLGMLVVLTLVALIPAPFPPGGRHTSIRWGRLDGMSVVPWFDERGRIESCLVY